MRLKRRAALGGDPLRRVSAICSYRCRKQVEESTSNAFVYVVPSGRKWGVRGVPQIWAATALDVANARSIHVFEGV